MSQRKNDVFGTVSEKKFTQLTANLMVYPNGQAGLELRAIGGGDAVIQIVGRVDELVAELKRVIAWLEGEPPSV